MPLSYKENWKAMILPINRISFIKRDWMSSRYFNILGEHHSSLCYKDEIIF